MRPSGPVVLSGYHWEKVVLYITLTDAHGRRTAYVAPGFRALARDSWFRVVELAPVELVIRDHVVDAGGAAPMFGEALNPPAP